jgi:hypothetical protein
LPLAAVETVGTVACPAEVDASGVLVYAILPPIWTFLSVVALLPTLGYINPLQGGCLRGFLENFSRGEDLRDIRRRCSTALLRGRGELLDAALHGVLAVHEDGLSRMQWRA